MDQSGQIYFGAEDEIPEVDRLRLERERAKLQQSILDLRADDEGKLGVAGSE